MESKNLLTMLDYEEGFHAAALGLPLDSNASVDWQKGWHDCKLCDCNYEYEHCGVIRLQGC